MGPEAAPEEAVTHPAPPLRPLKPTLVRVDVLLVSRGVVEDTKAATALVLAGDVFVRGDHRVASGAFKVAEDAPLRVRTKRDHPWASRGGLKLAHALALWPEVAALARGAVALDVGSSTGGFTDVLLAHGAARVYTVDVGKGLLDWRLRTDPRVAVREGRNARELSAADLEPADAAAGVRLVVCDASFIRLATVLPAALALCAPGAALVALVKPQFEARREDVGEGGVVRDPAVHDAVCARAVAWLGALPGWRVDGLDRSPVLGPSGNVEFLLRGTKTG